MRAKRTRFDLTNNCRVVDSEGFEDDEELEDLIGWGWQCMLVFSFQIPHVNDAMTLSIQSTLDEGADNEAWAIDGVQITTLSCGPHGPPSPVPVREQ